VERPLIRSATFTALAGNDVVGDALPGTGADQTVARVGDAGIAAVRTEDDLRARLDGLDDPLRRPFLVPLAVGDHLGARHAEVREQLPGAAGVLAGDEGGGLEGL